MALCRYIFAVFLFLAAASQAQAACSPFPSSEYLGSFTHAQVRDYVGKAHGGDWTPYLVTLQKNLTDLESVQRTDSGTVINVRGTPTKLNASALDRFVYTSRQWLQVAQCLAEEQNIASLNNFSTAAGGDSRHDAANGRGGFSQAAARLLLHSVTRRDVTYFVCEHRGEFCLRVHKSEQAAINVDIARGKREGIDLGIIDNSERIV